MCLLMKRHVMEQKDTKTNELIPAQLCPPPWAADLGQLPFRLAGAHGQIFDISLLSSLKFRPYYLTLRSARPSYLPCT